MKLKFLGPGLLYAGAAVGVSHLVQSTRAGALYGFELLLAILVVNILKYPFFEIGTRYTIASGKSLQEGYKSIGTWALWVFLGITLGTMFIIVAVVTMVTAGLVQNLTGWEMDIWKWSSLILVFSSFILVYGKYALLDRIIKVVIVLLTISTIASLVLAVTGAPEKISETVSFSFYNHADILFLVALLGWMPIPIEAAVWQSDWTLESRKKNGGDLPDLDSALWDFRIGYWGTTFLAICFLSLGALMMHGSGKEFSPGAVAFSHQLVELISENLGSWAYPFIALATSLTMISTTFTCLDAYPRVVSKTLQSLFPEKNLPMGGLYKSILVVTVLLAIMILVFFRENMRTMIDFAATISFLTAPLLAGIHYLIGKSRAVSGTAPISTGMNLVSLVGITFLSGLSLYYIYLVYIIQ